MRVSGAEGRAQLLDADKTRRYGWYRQDLLQQILQEPGRQEREQ